MKPRISLGVRDFARSFAFYHRGLGFALHGYKARDNFAMIRLEGSWLSIFPRDLLAGDTGVASTACAFPGFTLSHNVVSRAQVDTVHAFALARA